MGAVIKKHVNRARSEVLWYHAKGLKQIKSQDPAPSDLDTCYAFCLVGISSFLPFIH